jgi:hypothetical protein
MPVICPGCGYKKNDEFAQHCKRCSLLLISQTSSWEEAEPQIKIAVVGMENMPEAPPPPSATADKLRGVADIARRNGIITPKGAILLDQVIGFVDRQVLSDDNPKEALERTVEMLGSNPLVGHLLGGGRNADETVEQVHETVKHTRAVLADAHRTKALMQRLGGDLHAPAVEGLVEEILPGER